MPGEIHNNAVMTWCGEIDDEFLALLIRHAVDAAYNPDGSRASTGPPEERMLLLASTGGSALLGLAAMEWARPMTVVSSGRCYSAALHILACARRRLALPNTRFLFHSSQVTVESSPLTHVVKEIAEIEAVDEAYVRELARSTAKSSVWWEERLPGPFYFGTNEALEYGVIDAICTEEPWRRNDR